MDPNEPIECTAHVEEMSEEMAEIEEERYLAQKAEIEQMRTLEMAVYFGG